MKLDPAKILEILDIPTSKGCHTSEIFPQCGELHAKFYPSPLHSSNTIESSALLGMNQQMQLTRSWSLLLLRKAVTEKGQKWRKASEAVWKQKEGQRIVSDTFWRHASCIVFARATTWNHIGPHSPAGIRLGNLSKLTSGLALLFVSILVAVVDIFCPVPFETTSIRTTRIINRQNEHEPGGQLFGQHVERRSGLIVSSCAQAFSRLNCTFGGFSMQSQVRCQWNMGIIKYISELFRNFMPEISESQCSEWEQYPWNKWLNKWMTS